MALLHEPTIKILKDLAQLEENWDGYKANKIQQAAITTAAKTIEILLENGMDAPQVSPRCGGGIALSWTKSEMASHHIEFWIDADGKCESMLFGDSDGFGFNVED